MPQAGREGRQSVQNLRAAERTPASVQAAARLDLIFENMLDLNARRRAYLITQMSLARLPCWCYSNLKNGPLARPVTANFGRLTQR
jgi:hypothetical protein